MNSHSSSIASICMASTFFASQTLSCLLFFWIFCIHQQPVPSSADVALVVASLQNMCQANWVQADKACLLTYSFNMFLTEFKNTFLPVNWETNTHIAILNTCQKVSNPFNAFAYSVQAQNMSLEGTESHMNQEVVKIHFNVAMHPLLWKVVNMWDNAMIELVTTFHMYYTFLPLFPSFSRA